MRIIRCIFLLGFYFITHLTFSQESAIDIISYDINAKFDFSNKIIMFNAKIKTEKKTGADTIKILLCSLASIKYVKSENILLKPFRKNKYNDTLCIVLPKKLNKNDTLNFSFEYTLPIDSIIFSAMIVLRREVRWYPLQYDDIASMNLDVVAPKNYDVFAMGNSTEKKEINNNFEYQFKHNGSTSFALILIKSENLTQITKKIDSVNINFYFASTDTSVNNKIVNEVSISFSFYNKFIGKYKYKHLNLVEIADNRMQLVQSLSTLIIMGSPFIKYLKLGYGDWPPHETAHQWWGAGIFINSKTKGHWFLEESVNEYFKALYIQHIDGNDSLNIELKKYLANYNYVNTNKEKPIFDIKNVTTQDDGLVIYQKGPLVVNKLRNLIGSESYEKFIQEIYRTYCGKLLTYNEFIKVLKKYDIKNNIIDSLNNWLSEAGYHE